MDKENIWKNIKPGDLIVTRLFGPETKVANIILVDSEPFRSKDIGPPNHYIVIIEGLVLFNIYQSLQKRDKLQYPVESLIKGLADGTISHIPRESNKKWISHTSK